MPAEPIPAEDTATALHYPFADRPAPGEAIDVAPGVLWMRMPLPYVLNHVNLWAIDDGDGWAVVDTGVLSDEITAAWQQLFAGALGGRPVSRVFITHLHPDHVGMAGWLTRHFDCPLWMTRQEYLQARMIAAESAREVPQSYVDFLRRTGWNDAALDAYRGRFGSFGLRISPLPDTMRCIRDGERIRIGRHEWQVVVGTGHSPEHACLYCPALKLLIAGDQVLPRITTNVSIQLWEPHADPLGDWKASLDKIRATVPDDVLVLPSHNDPFRGLHARLDQLMSSTDDALDKLRTALAKPHRAVDVFGALFKRQIDPTDSMLLSMATGEALASLNHLRHLREAVVEDDASGVAWYRLGTPAARDTALLGSEENTGRALR